MCAGRKSGGEHGDPVREVYGWWEDGVGVEGEIN